VGGSASTTDAIRGGWPRRDIRTQADRQLPRYVPRARAYAQPAVEQYAEIDNTQCEKREDQRDKTELDHSLAARTPAHQSRSVALKSNLAPHPHSLDLPCGASNTGAQIHSPSYLATVRLAIGTSHRGLLGSPGVYGGLPWVTPLSSLNTLIHHPAQPKKGRTNGVTT
jgi:hypothetical protein